MILRSYRRRFVIYVTVLVGLVLLIALSALGIFLSNNARSELENTMRQVLRPWDRGSGELLPVSELERGKKPEGPAPDAPEPGSGREDRPPPERMGGISGEDGSNIVTVIVNSDTGEVSVLSADRDADAGLVSRAAQSLGDAPEGFGELSQFSLSYYKENTAEGFKLALADASGLRGRIAGICLSLVLVYVFLMTAVFFISLGLSKLAAKPMESALEMERGFVADISHDLKTPITVILANNSILRSDPALADSRLSQWTDSTETAAKSMMKLVEEMLTLSALESPRAKPEPVVCDLSGAAEKAALQLESVSYDRGVELETAIEPGIYTRATEEFLDRIAGGLIENALKYEPEGGKVTVTLTSAKKKAVFSVKNRLSRISPEDLPHVFERFYRSDKTRGDKKGFGLGLPIISRITALLGGSVTASSDREGTVFTVELPVCSARESGQVNKTPEV